MGWMGKPATKQLPLSSSCVQRTRWHMARRAESCTKQRKCMEGWKEAHFRRVRTGGVGGWIVACVYRLGLGRRRSEDDWVE